MTNVRFETTEDTMNDCITIIDNEEQLKTSFDSDIILYPAEDACTVIDELNVQCATVKMLRRMLNSYDVDLEDIDYWIQEVREDME